MQKKLIFKAGQKYSIRTQTVMVSRTTYKPNGFTGELEKFEASGQELAIYISDGIAGPQLAIGNRQSAIPLTEYCFMDGKLKADKRTKIADAKKSKDAAPSGSAIDFTLQELAGHFIIPEVPDVATNNPAGYQQNLEMLAAIEQLTEAFV